MFFQHFIDIVVNAGLRLKKLHIKVQILKCGAINITRGKVLILSN